MICNSTDCSHKADIEVNATDLVLQETGHNTFKNCKVVQIIYMGNDPNIKLIFS
jgi:hypothetical protein